MAAAATGSARAAGSTPGRLETAVLAKIEADLQEECSISPDGGNCTEFDETRSMAASCAAEKRWPTWTQQIGRTVDLAAEWTTHASAAQGRRS